MGIISQEFSYTGGWQKWKVPANVTRVRVTLDGGGSRNSEAGRVVGNIRVKDTDELFFFLGRRGHQTSSPGGAAAAEGGGGPGGNGGPGRVGGDGGGGGSQIRLNGSGGKLLAVAGGAGGRSGDLGTGGAGGGRQGEKGNRADASGNRATGGTQGKGGDGGTVGTNAAFNGDNAPNTILGRGAKGGGSNNDKAYGGGGGGGGYHVGGGGQAGKNGSWFGGGGGGGSSFVDEMFDVTVNSGTGGTGDGHLTIEWQEFGDFPPVPPTDVKINGVAETDEMVLHSYSALITGKPYDATPSGWVGVNSDVRLLLILSDSGPILEPLLGHNNSGIQWATPYLRVTGTYDPGLEIDKIQVNGLLPNKLYHGRLYSQDKRGQSSENYVSLKFWTNRPPNPPTLTAPLEDTTFESIDNIEFAWDSDDPDEEPGFPETTIKYSFRWRRAATIDEPATPWVQSFAAPDPGTVTLPASTFAAGATYEWQVAVGDPLGLYSPWSNSGHFHVTAAAVAPNPLAPRDGEARIYNEEIRFTWQFRTLISGETQETVDLRYRTYGSTDEGDWVTILGDLITPADDPFLDVAAETFNPGVHYEWQVRSHTSSATTSPWSISRDFWSANPPGLSITDLIPLDGSRPQGALGEGNNRAFVYLRGGLIPLGEIKPFSKIVWDRKRDAISKCDITVNEWNDDQRDFYKTIKSWACEIVVWREVVRDNEKLLDRVWEGPVTRRTSTKDTFGIEARDPMAYVYRRLMRQGYNDSYQINAGQQVGLKPVVWRARQIILNSLVYDDPNVLPYLNSLMYATDAVQSRVIKAFTKTAWQEIDDMAAHAGLDYTTIGRRIILNDTHRPIGRLPEMGDGDFNTPPVVTEYGMSYATDFGVTNNNGVYGLAKRWTGDDFEQTGHIEMLASEYGESDIAGAGVDDLTPAQIAALQATLSAQAERNIAPRYPMPVVVRIPDNATLNPEINLGINQLIPGAWVPLRATEGIIEASQWQKLDSVTVTQDSGGEKIALVMSPAPNQGTDPDADLDIEGDF